MKRIIQLCLVSILFVGCNSAVPPIEFTELDDPQSLDSTVSAVTSTPKPNEQNVAVDAPVEIKFSGEVDWKSVDFFRFRVEDEFGVPLRGEISINSKKDTLRFQPKQGRAEKVLRPSTTYTVRSRFLRNKKQIIIGSYTFKFRTEEAVEATGEFQLKKIFPDSSWVIPSNKITLEFNEDIAMPTAGDDNNPFCSRVQWADAFQIAIVRFFEADGNIDVHNVGGIACIKSSNRKLLEFTPDSDLPIFPELSVVRITIKPADGLRGELSGQMLEQGKEATKVVTPNPAKIANLLFGGN